MSLLADVAVIGAGSFGAWTAWHLERAGRRVLLIDAYGPANSRASSGGESRIIRMGYGAREIYTRWSIGSMALWREFIDRTDPSLFHQCGCLWIAAPGEPFATDTAAVLSRCGVSFEKLEEADLRRRWPQFSCEPGAWAIFEPDAGALMARRAIQTLVRTSHLPYVQRAVKLEGASVQTNLGESVSAGAYVFACGPWLAKLFPEILARRIAPSRQEVFFFGPPPGEVRFGASHMPCWVDIAGQFYGIPDLEGRGFKLAHDARGPVIDPDTEQREPSPEALDRARRYLSRRFPALAGAPLIETRICQYENTANSEYLIDRHPELPNVWLVGGGSGHGFKHGPAVGEYLTGLLLGGDRPDDRFSLASKAEQGLAQSSL
ncbi:MAG: FAD-dependent oxidoreductase [Acidobacteria bacterium]|nr:FAD-dependent oxidoreductase [Acidobacteriota bacterium]